MHQVMLKSLPVTSRKSCGESETRFAVAIGLRARFDLYWKANSAGGLLYTGRHAMVECLPVNRIELLQGTLDLMILQTLRWGPQHGHGIGQAIRASSQDAIQVEHGSLYPALHRLERRGWLAAEWKISEANRRARYYWLTPRGKKQLLEEQSKWRALVRAVAQTTKPIRG